MDYFDNEENVETYIKSAEGYDGRDLVAVLKKYLVLAPPSSNWGWGRGRTWTY